MTTPAELKAPAHRAALFLDIDGTLLDVAPRPDAVAVPASLTATLARLHRALGGALAFVSGRMIGEIDRLFAPLRFDAAAEHGAVLRRHGRECAAGAPAGALAAMHGAARRYAAARPGLLVEAKQCGLAIHFRGCPGRRHEVERFLAAALADGGGAFELLPGKMVWEVRPRGVSKGGAIAAMLAEPPYRGRLPVFAGDDLTDEDGFAVVAQAGGLAVRVGAGPRGAGGCQLASPEALRAWLGRLAQAADGAEAPAAR